jgi:hypothetical protein
MRVLFNAGSDFATTTFDPKTGQRSSGIIDGANPDLKILRYFENIKYLRLETAAFPRYYSLLWGLVFKSYSSFLNMLFFKKKIYFYPNGYF